MHHLAHTDAAGRFRALPDAVSLSEQAGVPDAELTPSEAAEK
jgi:hypothetical protein